MPSNTENLVNPDKDTKIDLKEKNDPNQNETVITDKQTENSNIIPLEVKNEKHPEVPDKENNDIKKLENIQPTIENNTIDNNTGKQTVSPDSDNRKDNGNKNNDTEQSNQEKNFKLK